jgi:hypothetical protein
MHKSSIGSLITVESWLISNLGHVQAPARLAAALRYQHCQLPREKSCSQKQHN